MSLDTHQFKWVTKLKMSLSDFLGGCFAMINNIFTESLQQNRFYIKYACVRITFAPFVIVKYQLLNTFLFYVRKQIISFNNLQSIINTRLDTDMIFFPA